MQKILGVSLLKLGRADAKLELLGESLWAQIDRNSSLSPLWSFRPAEPYGRNKSAISVYSE
jgi:hypothetical protein